MSLKALLLVLSISSIGLILSPFQSPLDGTWQSEVLTGGSLQLWSMELSQDGTTVTGTVWQGLNRDEIQGGRAAASLPGAEYWSTHMERLVPGLQR